jgi:hypothetical protein
MSSWPLTIILHLHPGNILLTTQKMTVLGVLSGETDLTGRLCNFGQSRRVTEISPSAFSNQRAANRYRAPELSGRNACHTSATDTYAAGIFIFDVLALVAMSVEPNTPVPVPEEALGSVSALYGDRSRKTSRSHKSSSGIGEFEGRRRQEGGIRLD